jgi:hypothetical protein
MLRHGRFWGGFAAEKKRRQAEVISPWPAYGVVQNNEGWVNAEYNSLSVKLEQRLSHGLTAVEGYTWSRALDTGSSVRSHTSDSLFPQDPYDLQNERGLSTFNVSDRSVTSLLYEPLGRSLRNLIAMLDDLRAPGVKFHSLTEAIDTTTPTGRAM